MTNTTTKAKTYEQPTLKVIGTLHELTLAINKNFNSSDGLTFMGTPIGNSSA